MGRGCARAGPGTVISLLSLHPVGVYSPKLLHNEAGSYFLQQGEKTQKGLEWE